MSTADLVYEKLKDAPPARAQEVLNFLEFLEAKQAAANPVIGVATKPAARIEDFFGILKDSGVFAGDPVEIQRQMREDRELDWDRTGASPLPA